MAAGGLAVGAHQHQEQALHLAEWPTGGTAERAAAAVIRILGQASVPRERRRAT